MKAHFSVCLHAPSQRLGAAQTMDAFGLLSAKPSRNVQIIKPSEDATNLRSDWKKVGDDIKVGLEKAKLFTQ